MTLDCACLKLQSYSWYKSLKTVPRVTLGSFSNFMLFSVGPGGSYYAKGSCFGQFSSSWDHVFDSLAAATGGFTMPRDHLFDGLAIYLLTPPQRWSWE